MDYLKPSEAAKLLNVSYFTLKQWIYEGKVHSIKTAGGHHRIPRSEIDKFINQDQAASAAPERPAGREGEHRWRILIAEDNSETREFLAAYLTHWGYEVTTAATGVEAWNHVQTQQFDLYILDNWLPDTLGTELCRRIRERDFLTPIIFFSAIVNPEVISEARKAGAQEYLRKDRFEVLKERIDWLLHNPEAGQDENHEATPAG